MADSRKLTGTRVLSATVALSILGHGAAATPIVQTGDILVADAAAGIVKIDPITGAETLLAGGFGLRAKGVAVDDLGNVYFSSELDGINNSVIRRIDRDTGNVSIVASGPSYPAIINDIDFDLDGKTLLAAIDRGVGGNDGGIAKINLESQGIDFIAIGPGARNSRSLEIDPTTGNIFFNDFTVGGSLPNGKIIEIDRNVSGLSESVVAEFTALTQKEAITITDDGKLLAGINALPLENRMLLIDLQTRIAETIVIPPSLAQPRGMDVDADGFVVIAAVRGGNAETGKFSLEVDFYDHVGLASLLQDPLDLTIVGALRSQVDDTLPPVDAIAEPRSAALLGMGLACLPLMCWLGRRFRRGRYSSAGAQRTCD